METTMSREGTYRPVAFGGAFLEQFRLLWMSRRPILLLVGMLAALALSGEPWNDDPVARLFAMWPLWLVLVGPFWAFTVWYQEGPSNRLYFWSQPVSRTAHALARVAAGAAWLWLLYAVLILAGAVFATMDGDVEQFGEIAFHGWAGLFISSLLGYLIVSVLAVPSEYPIRWFLGLLLGIPITISFLHESLGLDRFLDVVLTPLADERWGLGATMIGPFLVELSELQRWLRGDVSAVVDNRFDLGRWWLVWPLWVAFWAGVVALLASRHPDRFPRFRRSG